MRYAPRWLSIISYPTRPRGIIVKYSLPSEWIMCELGVFPFFFFLEKDLLKVDKTLGLNYFKTKKKKRLRKIQNGVFPFTVAELCAR